MSERMRRCAAAWSAVVIGLCPVVGWAAGAEPLVKQVLRQTHVTGGICVHMGLGDGGLAVALARSGRFLVQGFSPDPAVVEKTRKDLRAEGVYGLATVEPGPGDHLPYVDNLVNVVVVEDAAAGPAARPSINEIIRVLRPSGCALLRGVSTEQVRTALTAGAVRGEVASASDGWVTLTKPRPAEMDDWTHRGHDGGRSYVSGDVALGPITGVQWVAGPYWPIGRKKTQGNAGIVLAGGRYYCITFTTVHNFDKTPFELERGAFHLLARDAFNGTLLWTRPMDHRYPVEPNPATSNTVYTYNRTPIETILADVLVAVGDRVYTVLSGEVVALDGATGEVAMTFEKDASPSKLLYWDRRLVLIGGVKKTSVRVYDAATGQRLWERELRITDGVADEGRMYCLPAGGNELACVDLRTGKDVWRASVAGQGYSGITYAKGGIVAFRMGSRLKTALNVHSARDGRFLWSRGAPGDSGHQPIFLHVDGLVWAQTTAGAEPKAEAKTSQVGMDPMTGQVKRSLDSPYASGGCCPQTSTERYVVGTRPILLLDVKDGKTFRFEGGRHSCISGVAVGNGLLYSMPHGCCCVNQSIRGFTAFCSWPAPAGRSGSPDNEKDRLLKGPAFGEVPKPPAGKADPADWTTFRHDPQRSGVTPAKVPVDLRLLWQADLDDQSRTDSILKADWQGNTLGRGPLTAPTVAGGTVYVGLVDSHQVIALDAESGKVKWSRTAGGRLDTPPTIWGGLCLFGAYDGWATCLRADDGEVVWRFRAAPDARRINAFGQLESLWPVVGGVLVDGGEACFLAGRSGAVHGGVHFYAVEPHSGKLLKSATSTTANAGDILTSDGGSVRPVYADPALTYRLASPTGGGKGCASGQRPLMDRSWHVHATRNKIIGKRFRHIYSFWGHTAQLVIGDPVEKRAFGYRWVLDPNPNLYFSRDIEQLGGGHIYAWKGGPETGSKESPVWSVQTAHPLHVEALALAGETLFVAGPPDKYHRDKGGFLWALAAGDGARLAQIKLPSPPVPDGIAAAGGRLYVATEDGRLLCFGSS